jgi:hypothetical protein
MASNNYTFQRLLTFDPVSLCLLDTDNLEYTKGDIIPTSPLWVVNLLLWPVPSCASLTQYYFCYRPLPCSTYFTALSFATSYRCDFLEPTTKFIVPRTSKYDATMAMRMSITFATSSRVDFSEEYSTAVVKDKSAVVTGGAQGIGGGCSTALAEAGYIDLRQISSAHR